MRNIECIMLETVTIYNLRLIISILNRDELPRARALYVPRSLRDELVESVKNSPFPIRDFNPDILPD